MTTNFKQFYIEYLRHLRHSAVGIGRFRSFFIISTLLMQGVKKYTVFLMISCHCTLFENYSKCLIQILKNSPKWTNFGIFLSTDHSKCKRSSLRSQCKMRHFCNFQTLCVAAFLFLLLLVNFLYCVACRYWKIGSRNHFLIFSMIRGLCVAICCLEFHDVKIKVRNVK